MLSIGIIKTIVFSVLPSGEKWHLVKAETL